MVHFCPFDFGLSSLKLNIRKKGTLTIRGPLEDLVQCQEINLLGCQAHSPATAGGWPRRRCLHGGEGSLDKHACKLILLARRRSLAAMSVIVHEGLRIPITHIGTHPYSNPTSPPLLTYLRNPLPSKYTPM